jgi:hypothetical protein
VFIDQTYTKERKQSLSFVFLGLIPKTDDEKDAKRKKSDNSQSKANPTNRRFS